MNKKLEEAVLTQVGISKKEFKKNSSDYRSAQNGISGFTYYSETHEFALKNQKLINELLDEFAEDQGIEIVEMVKQFSVFNGGMDKDELKDLYKFLGGNKDKGAYKTMSVLNVLAWLCVETLAYEFE